MELDTTLPFRGSDAVRRGDLTWGVLTGPRFRRLDFDTYVDGSVPDTPLLGVRAALTRAGPEAFATGWSACLALGLDVARGRRPVEIASARRLWPGTGTIARRRHVEAGELAVAEGVRTTTALRTAYDLARGSGPDLHAVDRIIDPLSACSPYSTRSSRPMHSRSSAPSRATTSSLSRVGIGVVAVCLEWPEWRLCSTGARTRRPRPALA